MAVVELPGLPNLGRLYARTLGSLVDPRGRPDALPDRAVEVADVEVRADHVADYADVCGFRLADEVPVTYPHLLGFPLSVHLMAAGDFPFPLPGLVHVAQRVRQSASIRVGDRLDVRVTAGDLRQHRRGRQFDVVTDIARDGASVWTGTSTYLRRERAGDGAGSSGGRDHEAAQADASSATLRLPADLGRRYGAVSGDRNPIHLHPLTARLAGFPRPIAHGMWTAARCVAAVDEHLRGTADLEVAFKQPVPLPSVVRLRTARTRAGWRFSLHDRSGARLHLTGTLDREKG
ncbi:MaoC/PaaZ C-terminal domain-containing protein [Egicoccus sp. AB-alg2]|uniref:MaoC family dehydratase n=1 Tax=Egicoccus sp. AB-alg2 TaxID=3242693 RepID=UPI00359E336E